MKYVIRLMMDHFAMDVVFDGWIFMKAAEDTIYCMV